MSARTAAAKAMISALKTPPAVEALQGTQSRVAAAVQGHVWAGMASTVVIVDRAETAERIDERGDREQRTLLANLLRIARAAKQRREYETHRALMDEIARTRLVIELDGYEDDHRHVMADEAIEANGAMHRANGGVGLLLGQAEAVCDLDVPHPLSLCSIQAEHV